MTFLITLLCSVVICATVLGVMQWSKKATYRITRPAVARLFEWVLLGQATDNDWRVFCDIPIHHDPFLEALRLDCLEIDEQFFIGDSHPPFVLDKPGRSLLKHQLENLRQHIEPKI